MERRRVSFGAGRYAEVLAFLRASKNDPPLLPSRDCVLCKDDGSYHTCAQNYEKGIYDENTGQELNRERKPKPNGRLIRRVIAKSEWTVDGVDCERSR